MKFSILVFFLKSAFFAQARASSEFEHREKKSDRGAKNP
jgi:hypothetical protein